MISALFFLSLQGEIVLSRFYRDDVDRSVVDAFRIQVIANKEVNRPIAMIDRTSFLYVRKADMYVLAVTKANSNPVLVFEFLFQLIRTFEAYFGAEFNENGIRNNFVVIFELLDEMADFGYPQVTSVDLLSKYIKSGAFKEDWVKKSKDVEEKITAEITGNLDWREDGKYKYRKNEVYIDVIESINLLKSTKGEVLRADVAGQIMMKTQLSGMPECKLGLNDKVLLDKEKNKQKRSKGAIAIEDVRFHRCVRLGEFDEKRTISFVPPDGEFELMSYRVTNNINPPFNVVPVVEEISKSRVEYEIKVKGNFASQLYALNVVVKIPTPPNAAKHKVTTGSGRWKYDPSQNCILWKFSKFTGSASYQLKAEVTLLSTMTEKAWSRPPITMDFQVPMFAASGMHVRFLKITVFLSCLFWNSYYVWEG